MLTTPGSALLINAETSTLSGDDGATDALLNPPPTSMMSTTPAPRRQSFASSLPAIAPPTVPPAIVETATAASAQWRRPDRPRSVFARRGIDVENGG